MSAPRIRFAGIAFLALAVSASVTVRAEEQPETKLIAAAWSDSVAPPWFGRHLTTHSIPRYRDVIAAGSVAGGARQSAGHTIYAGRAAGRLSLPLTSRLAAEAHMGLLALDRGDPLDRRTTRTGATLRFGGEARNVWLGFAIERDLSGGQLPGGPLLALGGSARVSAAAFAASLEQTVERVSVTMQVPVTQVPGDTVGPTVATLFDRRLSTATTARLAGRWEHRRLAIETVAGLTLNRLASPYRWSQTSASLALMPRLSLFATIGNPAPRWLALDAGFERRATLGMRLTSWTNRAIADPEAETSRLPGWRLRPLGEDWYVIEIRAQGAGQVSVMGDFTEWNPLALRHVRGDRWAVALQIAPGVHQVQVRLDDGAWLPPKGLATTADGFNGSAGVFVAE